MEAAREGRIDVPSDPARAPVLREADLLGSILSVSADAVFMLDPDGRCTFASPAALMLLGKPTGELLGKPLAELGLAPVASNVLGRLLGPVSRRGRQTRAELQLAPAPDARWFDTVIAPIRTPEGQLTATIIMGRDVTERRLAEEASRERERWFRLLAESIPHLVWSARGDGFCDYFNKRFLDYLGTTLEQFQGWKWPQMLHPDDAARAADAWTGALRTGGAFQIEFRLRRADDGAYRWHVSHAVPLRDDAGKIVHWFGTCTDVHDERERTSELAQAKAALEQASVAKDHFLSVLSHELRNPLSPALATAAAMERDASLPQSTRSDAQAIRRNIEMEVRLIDDLLDINRIARGKLALRRSIVSLREVLSQSIEMCRGDALEKNIALHVELAGGEDQVYADPSQLQQVFVNVLKNGIKFTPAGGSVAVRTSRDAGGIVRIEVADTGIGIEPERLGLIFNAYEQGGAEVTRRFGGLGLGLAICKALVEAHGGTIGAASGGPGRGATFTVALPPATSLAPTHAPMRQARGLARPLRILLVEDHEGTARAMARLLRQMEHEVVVAGTLDAARRAASDRTLDLLISDLALPDGTGLDLIREMQAVRPIRGIALTGYGRDEDVARTREAGFAAHLTKPVDVTRLLETIERVAG